jgi:hypothetical protein
MFVSENIVYLQMQKTGSTHATILLEKYCGGRKERAHALLEDYERYKSRHIVSSVRNPWDWYVSLWAFGCARQGTLRRYLKRLPWSELTEALRHRDPHTVVTSMLRLLARPRNGRDWAELYSDVMNKAHFRRWLGLLLGPEGRHIGVEGYASSAVKKAVGFMTYRFLALTTEYAQWTAYGRKCRSYEEVVAFADDHTITDRILRMESLNSDLLSLFTSAGIAVPPEDSSAWSAHNQSVHRGYDEYYDDDTRELVAKRDRFIVDRFGYEFD